MRALIVGLGSIGRRHLKNLKALVPSAQVGVLRLHSRQKDIGDMAALADAVFTDEQEAVDFHPDMVIIANPAPSHMAIALTFARAGAHIFCEKPLSVTLTDIDPVIDECRRKNLVFMTGYVMRFSKSLKQLKQCIEDGLIGKVLYMRAEVGKSLDSWRPGQDYRKSISASRELGGGVLFELSHELDYMRWLGGEVKMLQAWVGKVSDLQMDTEDLSEVQMTLDSGVLASVHVDMIDHASHRGCRVVGSKGTLVWNFDGKSHHVRSFTVQEGAWRNILSVVHEPDEMYLEQFRHFLQCINEQRRPCVDGEAGRRVVEIILAAKQSAEQGQRISL